MAKVRAEIDFDYLDLNDVIKNIIEMKDILDLDIKKKLINGLNPDFPIISINDQYKYDLIVRLYKEKSLAEIESLLASI